MGDAVKVDVGVLVSEEGGVLEGVPFGVDV